MTPSVKLGATVTPFENLVQTGLSRKQALAKLTVDNLPPTGAENYVYLQIFWDNEHMQSFADFLKLYKNRDVVPELEAMQKMVEFYHNKRVDILKLGCTLPNLAKICSHKSKDSRFFVLLSKRTKNCRRKYKKIWLVDCL